MLTLIAVMAVCLLENVTKAHPKIIIFYKNYNCTTLTLIHLHFEALSPEPETIKLQRSYHETWWWCIYWLSLSITLCNLSNFIVSTQFDYFETHAELATCGFLGYKDHLPFYRSSSKKTANAQLWTAQTWLLIWICMEMRENPTDLCWCRWCPWGLCTPLSFRSGRTLPWCCPRSASWTPCR